MSKPRVFISSTYYDLKYMRSDLERAIQALNYEPILYEKGQVPYHAEKQMADACYREVEYCDILVSIIGGRYGAASKKDDYSISNIELKTALELGKPIYVFIEKNVLAEYRTYEKNKAININYASVDDVRIFKFIEELYSLAIPQPIVSFESSQEIVDFLREQWAGLFQSMLKESVRKTEMKYIQGIQTTADTLNKLVGYLTEKQEKGDETLKSILMINHPLFSALKKRLDIPYRIYFTDLSELNTLLKARKTEVVNPEAWDDPKYREWLCKWFSKGTKLLKIKKDLFDDKEKLKLLTVDEWKDSYISLEDYEVPGDDGEPD